MSAGSLWLKQRARLHHRAPVQLVIQFCVCAAGYEEPEAVSEDLLEDLLKATINYSFLLAVNSTENVTMCTPEELQEAEFELSAFCAEVRPPTV